MMKDDGLLVTRALKAFTDIANSLTAGVGHSGYESQISSPLFTGCGCSNAPVYSLCPNRELIGRSRGQTMPAKLVP